MQADVLVLLPGELLGGAEGKVALPGVAEAGVSGEAAGIAGLDGRVPVVGEEIVEDGVATEPGKAEDVPGVTGAVGLKGMGEVKGAGLTGLPDVEGGSGTIGVLA